MQETAPQNGEPSLSLPQELDYNTFIKGLYLDEYQDFVNDKNSASPLTIPEAELLLSEGKFHGRELSANYPSRALRNLDSVKGKLELLYQRLFFFRLVQRSPELANAILSENVHFSHATNSSVLDSVYEKGLLPRLLLESQGEVVKSGEFYTSRLPSAKHTTTGDTVSLASWSDIGTVASYSGYGYENRGPFPVCLLISLDENQQDRCIAKVRNNQGKFLTSDIEGEVGYPDSIDTNHIPILLVPQKWVKVVQKKYPKWRVFDLESYMGYSSSKFEKKLTFSTLLRRLKLLFTNTNL